MNLLSYIVGGDHVEQSDEYPWGTNVVLGPFSIEFAKKLRGNGFNNLVAEEYKKFLSHKIFKIVPSFIVETRMNWLSEIIKGDHPKRDISIIEMNEKMINEFINYRKNLLLIKKYSESEEAKTQRMLIETFSGNSSWMGLRKRPLMWLNVVGTDVEEKFYKTFLNELNIKKDLATRDYYYAKLTGVLAKLVGIIENGDIEETDFKDDSGMGLLNEKDYDYASLAVKKIEGSHQLAMVIDHGKKYVYFIDSNGFNYDTSKIINIVLPERLSGYKKIAVASGRSCPKGMFQSISRDQFCQTWGVFLISLTTMNIHNLDDVNDINELFKKVVDEIKPICYYNSKMTDHVRLSLIIIEFMFYIFHTKKDDINKWLKQKELQALKMGVTPESLLHTKKYHPDVDLFIASDVINIDLSDKPVNEYIRELIETK